MPEEPPQLDPTPPPSVSGTVKTEDVDQSMMSVEESEEEDDGSVSEEEREKRIKELQQLVGVFLKL